MTTNSISFTSRINFVDTHAFENFRRGAYVDFRPRNQLTPIDRLMREVVGDVNCEQLKHPRHDVLKADEFYTDTVRTCAAGYVLDTRTKTAAGFHFYDSLENLESVKDMLVNIFHRVPNPDRAFLVGSKGLTCSRYSVPMFTNLYEGLSKRIPKITMFREHVFPYSETDFHYSVKDDTLTIRSMYKPLTDYREFDILTQEEMNKCYREIKIANGDTVTFQEKM